MDDAQLLRYSRHILLPEIGVEGQTALLNAHALVIGAGGLGSPAALYLGSAGVGQITLVDHDTVDLTNLQRQIAHTTDRIGQPKVTSAASALQAINPEISVHAVAGRATVAWLDDYLGRVDIVLDCTDNFETRQWVNAACVKHRKPLVWAAAVQMDAQLGFYAPEIAESACYACAFPPEVGASDANCATMGVLSPLVGAIGSLQAAMAIQWLARSTNSGDAVNPLATVPLNGRILMVDLRHWGFDSIKVQRRAACTVCAGSATQGD